jgi:predicted O-linked N-acetylglucosamine transferase (SPINDLY family)
MRADLDADTVARAHQMVGASMSRSAGPPYGRWDNPVDPDRRLRLGYVSGDLGFHPVGLFADPVIAGHDRTRFDVYCYSNAKDPDSMGRRMRESLLHWREVTAMRDDQIAELVRSDGIDILVDLSGHTNRNRLFVFARHPAPVQVTWLGYLNTTGLAAMDYRICDWHTDPDGLSEIRHTEALYRMPNSQWCYEPWGSVPSVPRAHLDRPDALVFGSFNQYPKLTDASIDLWSRILARLPQAEIVVFDLRDESNRQRVLDRFARNGVDRVRIGTRGRENLATFYESVGNTDIALDAFPYNGATTTFDVLWMGVPLVALAGERSISRGGVSILRTLGCSELVADTEDDYIEINVRLAQEPEWRDALRRTLRQRLLASPLMDLPRFIADLESGYKWMWRSWCSAQRPA